MTKNPWQLYSSMKGWALVSADLNRAWDIAKKFNTAEEAYDLVVQVQNKYAHYGATDSEPRAELFYRLRKRYGETCEYGSGWTKRIPYRSGILNKENHND